MTVSELLTEAAALMHEEDARLYEAFAPSFVNLVQAELFEVNNRIRKAKGKTVPETPQRVAGLSDEIDCEPELSGTALVFGVLARIFADEDNNPHLSMYKQEYANAVNEADRGWALWVV